MESDADVNAWTACLCQASPVECTVVLGGRLLLQRGKLPVVARAAPGGAIELACRLSGALPPALERLLLAAHHGLAMTQGRFFSVDADGGVMMREVIASPCPGETAAADYEAFLSMAMAWERSLEAGRSLPQEGALPRYENWA